MDDLFQNFYFGSHSAPDAPHHLLPLSQPSVFLHPQETVPCMKQVFWDGYGV